MTGIKINRREFIGGVTAAGVLAKSGFGRSEPSGKIDRFALVSRHNPALRRFEPSSPLSVGNGEFAFTCDVTGLQTFPELYKDAMPLCTMSQWGWHTEPIPGHLRRQPLRLAEYNTYGRRVGYATSSEGQKEIFDWLRENPHRLHLGQIGFRLLKTNGGEADPSGISDIEQHLDLWTGIIHSRFRFDGEMVAVRTAVHPTLDLLGVTAESELIRQRRLALRVSFPYASPSMQAADWNQRERHRSDLWSQGLDLDGSTVIDRFLDSTSYSVAVGWNDGEFEKTADHEFVIRGSKNTRLEVRLHFTRETVSNEPLLSVPETFSASEVYWKGFWTDCAVVDLTGSKDLRASELERRIVLSQYLTAIQCSGSTPPQETGLTCNSWYGKFHLEMHWWHAAHFALWNRFPLLEKSLDWYLKILPSARERAQSQEYAGARWPKMTSIDGCDSPSPIGPLLIWQQPHPIFYSELAYLSKPTSETLARYRSLVFETAEFMVSYAHYDRTGKRYVLGPPMIPAQENHPARETWNPTFELEYWRFGLTTAQIWRKRLGLKGDRRMDEVIEYLSPLPTKDGVYLAHENCPQTFTERNKDHPSMLAALGVLTGEKVDRETMRRTLKKVMKEWDWPETWGWDYPMVAMTAARLGEPNVAIDALLMDTPKNHYGINGHNYQRPNLPLYLPGNGGLLYAIALMANGWKGSPKRPAPGFPADESWTVRTEGFDRGLFQNI